MNRRFINATIVLLIIATFGVLFSISKRYKKEPVQVTGRDWKENATPPPTNVLQINDNAFAVPGSNSQPVCIELKKYHTAGLTNSLNSPTSVKNNNLSELPNGRQFFRSIPFDVEGIIQLSGKRIQEWGRTEFPESVEGISIGMRCLHIYLLHGAGGVADADGVTIGKLILHYADKTTQEIEIQAGVHVRDWWGNPNQKLVGLNSELAWSGKNEAILKYSAKDSVRVYVSCFENPQPDLVIERADYISTMRKSSPFLIGLTVQ